MSNIILNVAKFNTLIVPADIESNLGFYNFYYKNLPLFENRETCFDYCNAYYESKTGFFRMSCFNAWRGGTLSVNKRVETKDIPRVDDNSSAIIARTMLIKWFFNKGFQSAESFVPVVRAFYPEISIKRLQSFWDGDCIDLEVLEKVNFTHQILF